MPNIINLPLFIVRVHVKIELTVELIRPPIYKITIPVLSSNHEKIWKINNKCKIKYLFSF